MKKQRLKFRCWNCDREYSMTKELEGKPQLIVTCPYCDKEAIVDLSPFVNKTTTVFRGTEGETIEYQLPSVIPTSAPAQSS